MPWDGAGNFDLDPNYSPEVNGNIIDADRYNGLFLDIAEGITESLAKNGENVPTQNLPMGGKKHTGAAGATANGQYLVYGQSGAKLTDLEVTGTGTFSQYAVGIPRRTSGWANGECLSTATGVTLNTTDMAAGRAFSVWNSSAGNITITQGAGVTLYNGSDGTTGNRTLAAKAMATIWCESGTVAVIGGTKVT